MRFGFTVRRGISLAASAFLAGQVTSVAAQSLGDVARLEVERRQQVKSGKVYTNGDLAPVDPGSPPVPPTAAEPASSPGGETPATTPAKTPPAPGSNPGKEATIINGREKRDEEYWRRMIGGLRAQVQRANANVAAQEARLAELDAGPQTPTAVREREVVTETLNRAQRDARSLTDELTRFLTRAQMAKVPDEWIR